MHRALVIQQLRAYASGQLSREGLVEWAALIDADDDFVADEGTEGEPWRSSDDEVSLLRWLLDSATGDVRSEEEGRQDIARALACYRAAGAADTLVLMRLVFDQDRLCGILAKVERGIISRTGFLSVLSNALYHRSTKEWLTRTTPEGLQYLRLLLEDESYAEIVNLLQT